MAEESKNKDSIEIKNGNWKEATAKRGSFISSDKTITIRPGQVLIRSVKSGKQKDFPINDNLALNGHGTYLEFQFRTTSLGPRQTNFEHINTAKIRSDIRTRLNQQIRKQIWKKNETWLHWFYYNCQLTEPFTSPLPLIDELYSNFSRAVMNEAADPVVFAELLSATAKDPAILIFYLCCNIKLPAKTNDAFQNALLDLKNRVSTDWESQQKLLLMMFDYPINGEIAAPLRSTEALMWSDGFVSYRKLILSDVMLKHFLDDEMYLCYACIMHHVENNDTARIKKAFPRVPSQFLVSNFCIIEKDVLTEIEKPYFIYFIFHRNCSDALPTIYDAFSQAREYFTDRFFEAFLDEAFIRGDVAIVVSFLRKVLFASGNVPKVEALNYCTRIAITIVETMSKHRLRIESVAYKSCRELLEIAMELDYYVLNPDLSHITTLSTVLEAEPNEQPSVCVLHDILDLFNILQYHNYVVELCYHNLQGRETLDDGKGFKSISHCQKPSIADRSTPSVQAYALPEASAPNANSVTAVTATAIPDSYTNMASTAVMQDLGGDEYYSEANYADNHKRNTVETPSKSPADITMLELNAWRTRTYEQLMAIVYGYITLSICCHPHAATKSQHVENEVLSAFMDVVPENFFKVLLHPSTPLRLHINRFMQQVFKIGSLHESLLEDERFLSKKEHFQYNVLSSLSYVPLNITELMPALIRAMLKIEEYDDLYRKFTSIDETIGLSEEQRYAFKVVLDAINSRDVDDFFSPETRTGVDRQRRRLLTLHGVKFITRCAHKMLCRAREEAYEKQRETMGVIKHILSSSAVGNWYSEFSAKADIPIVEALAPRGHN